MTVPQSAPLRKQRRSVFRFLFIFALTIAMIATNGFGSLPQNSLSATFQQVIGESFPAELLNPFNWFMDKISAPQIPPGPDSGSDEVPPLDPVGVLLSLFEVKTEVTIISEPYVIKATREALQSTQTQIAFIETVRAVPTLPLTQTQTAIPLPTATLLPPTVTESATPVLYFPPIYFPPTPTFEPEEEEPIATELPTITPGYLVLYFGDTSAGNIGPRNSADALCTANLPAGFSNYHAFIGYSASDSIANMPSNYGISTNLPIQSVTNTVIANDWADLMDGSIAVALDSAGVIPSNNWWSGAENADGSHLDGITADCTEWTSNNNFVGGNEGLRSPVDSTWMDGFVAACDQPIAVLCMAY